MDIKIFKKKKNLAEQLNRLNKKYIPLPNSGIYGNELIWKQLVKPTEESKEYCIEIKYNYSIPKVYINNQGIMKEKDEKIPHTYERKYIDENKQIVRPCLYYPNYGEWKNYMYIADTIIPWTIEWLFYYEMWRITGEWLGGGIHNEK